MNRKYKIVIPEYIKVIGWTVLISVTMSTCIAHVMIKDRCRELDLPVGNMKENIITINEYEQIMESTETMTNKVDELLNYVKGE